MWVKSKRQREKEEKKRKEERLNNGDNNGQATHGARKYEWHRQAAWANFRTDSYIYISVYKFW